MKKEDIDNILTKGKVIIAGKNLDIIEQKSRYCAGCVFEKGISCNETAIDICTRGYIFKEPVNNKKNK